MSFYGDFEGTLQTTVKVGKSTPIHIRSNGGYFEYQDDGGSWIRPGTIVTQDADSVDIDGGNIDGTVIGANSPSTGVFSSLGVNSGVNSYTFPVEDGTADQILRTDGAGTLSWNSITELDAGTAQGQMLFWDNTGSKWTNTETSELVWDDTNKYLGLGTSSPNTFLDIQLSDTVSSLGEGINLNCGGGFIQLINSDSNANYFSPTINLKPTHTNKRSVITGWQAGSSHIHPTLWFIGVDSSGAGLIGSTTNLLIVSNYSWNMLVMDAFGHTHIGTDISKSIDTSTQLSVIKSDGDADEKAVYGESSTTGAFRNYGGYFVAQGDTGIGVYGEGTTGGKFNGTVDLMEVTTPSNETDIGKIYTKDVSTATELFYMDALGNEIQLTASGSINVTSLDAGTSDGQMLFWDSGTSKWTYTETTELVWDDTNKRLGLGISSPSYSLDIAENIGLVDTTNASTNGVIYKDGARFLHNFNYGDNGTVTTVGRNTFIGKNAGNFTMGATATNAIQSSYNTGVGKDVLSSNTIGYRNTGVGYSALYENTTGSNNIGVGSEAARYIADGVTANQTTSNSIYLGTDTKASADGNTNEIVIGYDTTGNGSNTVTLGNDSITDTILKGKVCIGTASSDENLTIDGAISLSEITAPTLTADRGKVYVKDVSTISELFYMDDSGNEIQLTSGGSINESPSTKIEWGTSNVTIEASGGDITLDNAGTNILTVSSGGFDVGASGQIKFLTSYDNGTTTDSILFETTVGTSGGGDIKLDSASNLYLNCTSNMYENAEMYLMTINGSTLWDIDDTRYCQFTPTAGWVTTSGAQIKFTSSLDNSSYASILLETTVGTSGGGDIKLDSSGDALIYSDGDIIVNSTNGDLKFVTSGGDLQFLIDSSGKMATGTETAPDTIVGGICFHSDTTSGNTISFKSAIQHEFTMLQESDTFATFELNNYGDEGWGDGSLKISGYGGDSKDWYNMVGAELWGYISRPNETTSTSGLGCVMIGGATLDSGSLSVMGNGYNLMVIKNYTDTKHIFKGGGDIVTDTGTVNSFDDEDDINLARAGAYSMSGQKDKIMDYGLRKYAKRLEELGIIENGFMSHNKINSLQLGAIGQLWNIVRGLGKRFGLTDRQLLEISKEYK